jgi:hypothetical protein
MGLKGYRLWVMGQLDSKCRAPPQGPERGPQGGHDDRLEDAREHRAIALQVAFERQTLKPVFSLDRLWFMGLKGYRSWVMGQLDSNVQSPTVLRCVVPTMRAVTHSRGVALDQLHGGALHVESS